MPKIINSKDMSPNEKRFVELFNKEREFASKLSDTQLIERIEELSNIAIEARARLTSIQDEKRSRDRKRDSI